MNAPVSGAIGGESSLAFHYCAYFFAALVIAAAVIKRCSGVS